MTVHVVTDSAASLPSELVSSHGIAIVPMQITVGDETRASDQFELREILDRLHDGVTTAGPTPGDFAQVVEGLPADDGVVVLTIASTMSSTHDSARLAAKLVERRMVVVDTCTAAGAEGLVVLAAASAASAGRSMDEVADVARTVSDEVRLVASLDGLDQLVRSGRVPQIAGWAGRKLGLQPLFEFRGGGARPLRPAGSRQAAEERMLDMWRKTIVPGARLHVAGMHADDPDGAERLLDAVAEEVTPASSFVGEFGPVMIAHTGPGLVGLAWYWEPPSP